MIKPTHCFLAFCLVCCCTTATLASCSSDDSKQDYNPLIDDPKPEQPSKPSEPTAQTGRNEQYRPQIHFTPAKNWINDPNGMVFVDGTYHLFYQYNPQGYDWGNMSWGHATSADLVHWTEQPVALTRDELGDIFSGSAVIDKDNTAGFGANAMVALYTSASNVQQQSIAYSTNGGKSFSSYTGNPVIRNNDDNLRDPKVFWHEQSHQWIMALAKGWKMGVEFYSSPDLKTWTHQSTFFMELAGRPSIQWECPDLFRLSGSEVASLSGSKVKSPDNFKTSKPNNLITSKTETSKPNNLKTSKPNTSQPETSEKWVLLVSVNPGGPILGSGTMYFIGDFDGKTFTADALDYPLWLDYGMDNYAGVTWSNTGNRKLMIGWMNNWQYAGNVPCSPWRSAMTLPRELNLIEYDGKPLLASTVVSEIDKIAENWQTAGADLDVKDAYQLRITLNLDKNSTITLSNSFDEKYVLDINANARTVTAHRTSATGQVSFNGTFSVPSMQAPLNVTGNTVTLDFFVDQSSVELFTQNGSMSMTNLVFPKSIYNRLTITGTTYEAQVRRLNSIWN